MNLAAVVLAAGSARRFGSDKLSAPLAGMPLVWHAIQAARSAPVLRVVVVAHPGLDLPAWNDAPGMEVLRVQSPELSASLKAGVAAAGDVDGVFVFLGDMPIVPTAVAAHLATALGDSYAAMPRHAGRPGHPVLLSAPAIGDVAALRGDAGAGLLLRSRSDVRYVDWPDAGIHADVDRPQDLADVSRKPKDR